MLQRTGAASLESKIARLQTELNEPPPQTPSGKRFEYQLTTMEPDLPRAAPYAVWIDEYKESLKALNLAHAGDVLPVPEGQSGYIGGAQCVDCHPEASEFWSKTRHAKA